MNPEQLPGNQAVERAFQHVVDTLKEATLRLIEVTDQEHAALDANFWPTHTALMEKHEALQPGITAQVFELFEQLDVEKREAEQEHFEQVTLPQAKRRAQLRGMFGRPLEMFDQL